MSKRSTITITNNGSEAQLEEVRASESIVRSTADLSVGGMRRQKKRKDKRKKSSAHKHKHRHHHSKRESAHVIFDNVEGVVRVVLTDEVQALLKCVVGENVTAEKPWTYISKFYIQEQVESDEVPEEFQTFLPHKQPVIDYPNDSMMIGYIPDESRDYDEFYFCLTLETEDQVNALVKLEEERQARRLENTIHKRVGEWRTWGSEDEIAEGWMTNTRGFYRIEFEARYPLISPEVRFRFRLSGQQRDGYVELRTLPRYLVPIVHRRRIDNNTQVAPSVIDNVAQTDCRYPRNAWTQYEYECVFVEKITKEFMAVFNSFTTEHMDGFYDHLHVNGSINFYTYDYADLHNQDAPSLNDGTAHEYLSFVDVKRCKDKMISAVAWHPMWTGVIALAYADVSPRWYYTERRDTNLMEEVVHGFNPVLIWSFNDSLNPKLILESPSEIHCLSFCPQDPNLLVGGCANGQVVLWDIKNKLSKVETEEVLSSAQIAYRERLFNEMVWMKNTRDYSIVPATAFSQLLYSHNNNVTGIQWIHPLYVVQRTGHIKKIDAEEPSLQFVTSSSDGTIKFWDLRQKAVITGDYKPVRKSRRLGKRPSALTMDVSPYRILNRRMLPHFELEVVLPNTEKMCPIASIGLPSSLLHYQEVNPDPNRASNITDRIIYEPIYNTPKTPTTTYLCAGTYTGDFMIANWEGYEYTSGDVFAKEKVKFMNIAKYHDGPVLRCERHPLLDDVYLSVGGKVFCVWSDTLRHRPLLWRRARHKYTHGFWEQQKAAGFRFTTADGSSEVWNLDYKSDASYSRQMHSGKPLLEAWVHPRPLKQQIVGIADDRGTLRLIQQPCHKPEGTQALRQFRMFVRNNVDRIKEFEEWQVAWADKHAGWIKEQREAELAEAARLHAEELDRQAYEEEERAREALEEAKREAAKLHPPPGMYEEWARERWILKEQERMGNELLSNKRLDTETLMKQQLPLKKLEVEAARKQQKIKQRLLKVDEIFTETIAMLFPNLTEKPPEDHMQKISYADDVMNTMSTNFLNVYATMVEESNTYIENNPFIYELDWLKVLNYTKARKVRDEFKYCERHSDRHRRYKIDRENSSIASASAINPAQDDQQDSEGVADTQDDQDNEYFMIKD